MGNRHNDLVHVLKHNNSGIADAYVIKIIGNLSEDLHIHTGDDMTPEKDDYPTGTDHGILIIDITQDVVMVD